MQNITSGKLSILTKLFVVAGTFLFIVSQAHATVIVRTADQLEVAEGDIVDGELVAVGLPVVLSNNVAQDATILGNRVKINAEIGADLLAAGFFVDVDGPVADDVRVVGGEVSLANEVAGDVIVFGGTVDILSTATVLGDVVVYGGAVNIAGSVGGDVFGVMESLQIDGSVGGGIDVDVTFLSLGDQASVTGSVLYTSHNLIIQALNANVDGEIVRSDPVTVPDSGWSRFALTTLLITLFSTLVWYLCSPKTLQTVVFQSSGQLLRSAFVGMLAPVVLLLIAVVLFVSQLGMYVGITLLLATFTLMMLAGAAAPALVGRLLLQLVGYPVSFGPLPIVLGSLVLTACLFVPIVGGTLVTVAVILSLGGLLEVVFRMLRT